MPKKKATLCSMAITYWTSMKKLCHLNLLF